MNLGKLLYVTNAKQWRQWLEKNYKSEPEIWLVYYKKETGKPRIPYNDAVEEALCFGWIDSTIKSIDSQKYAQRFSPRRSVSSYSRQNIERLKRLVNDGKVIKEVLDKLDAKLFEPEGLNIPGDILDAIKENKEAFGYFQKFSDSYKRIRIAYIEGARSRPDEFKKRLENFINKSSKNKLFGFGGIEKYYKP